MDYLLILDTPVTLFVYNRLDATKQVFDQVAAVKSSTLLVVVDGPRTDVPRDNEKCDRVRSYIKANVDWDGTPKTNYAAENLGLFDRFVTGPEWVFESVEEAIILKDDCVPNESFVQFCGSRECHRSVHTLPDFRITGRNRRALGARYS